MEKHKNILVPTDFSERAHNALDQAIYLGKKIKGKLIIYHVYHRPVEDGGLKLSEKEKRIDKQFEELKKIHPGLSGIPYEFKKELGISLNKFVEVIKREAIDLIVMATKGAKSFDVLWGTKTAKVIKQATMPVFVIPDNTSLINLKNVCLACDFSTSTDYHQLELLIDLAKKLELTINVVTLNRNERVMTIRELEHREKVIRKLESVKTNFHFTYHHNLEDGLVNYCLHNGINLIAILPKSYFFIERLFHESLTEKMTFRSPIPLVVLK
ncbi:universal stress protein [Flexithrix dorotheae]|uniref:universal stress protein n=1 Tax=Flexithrix dorotheae TaxID=70993 RepID=UPI00037D5DCA|nr:universal stress protein [Flexithrix dorotheae]